MHELSSRFIASYIVPYQHPRLLCFAEHTIFVFDISSYYPFDKQSYRNRKISCHKCISFLLCDDFALLRKIRYPSTLFFITLASVFFLLNAMY